MKLLAIAPYEGLRQLFLRVAEEEGLSIKAEVGNLDEGVRLAKKAADESFDVIISRGGTATLIQQHLSIPVVEIEISGYDLLKNLLFLKEYPDKKAIVGFPQITNGVQLINELLDVSFSTVTIHSEGEAINALKKLKAQGFESVLGDVITVNEAERLGMNGFLLSSGEESVRKAFNQAKRVVKALGHDRLNYELPLSYLHEQERGLVLLDQNNDVCFVNEFAKKFQLMEFINDHSFMRQLRRPRETGAFSWPDGHSVWYTRYKAVGNRGLAIEFAQLNEHMVNDHPKPIITGSDDPIIKQQMKKYLSSTSTAIQRTLKAAEAFSAYEEPIWIDGKPGTGAEALAYHITFQLYPSVEHMIIIDCSKMNERPYQEGVQELLSFFGAEQLAVLVKGLAGVTDEALKACSSLFQQVREGQPVLLLGKRKHRVAKQLGLKQLGGELQMPVLQERIDDIDLLSRLALHEMNMNYGKQIVGFREAALHALRNHHWTEHIDELWQVIQDAVKTADSSYIDETLLAPFLHSKEPIAPFHLTGTMKEIEEKIIYHVWLEEGKKHSKTAERLGMNRTTLWRKLKNAQEGATD
ncbi:PrpR N-terminal domain-containing protein [Shouchella clausii]|uniref:PrpR N-terminal domain-containing protein n=1 Tax=Shouchella clausii TaxID=79880 RepID=UPI0039830F4C